MQTSMHLLKAFSAPDLALRGFMLNPAYSINIKI